MSEVLSNENLNNKNLNNKKKRAVVICPGRGTYNKEELGYLKRLHGDKTEVVELIDDYRSAKQQISIHELDNMDKYNMRLHTAGENASALIYACAMSDYLSINQNEFDVVAVTGNSMGWYVALAVAGVLSPNASIDVINTMGSMMTDGVIGGQIIYPVTDEQWHENDVLVDQINERLSEVNAEQGCEVYISIHLGGYLVFGGNKAGLASLEKKLPVVQDRYPMNLFNHAAFHTPLLNDIATKAQSILSDELFTQPQIPLIDGLGKIWQPHSTDTKELYDYTLSTQVVEPYNFSKAIEVAIKEFSPDKLIILGPGTTLGGAVGQCLVKHQWLDLVRKNDFIALQKSDPYILAMGIAEQRQKVINT